MSSAPLKKQYRKKRMQKTGTYAGFTLLEALVAIGLSVMLLAVYTTMLSSTFFLRRSQHHVLASNLVQEQLDTLRTLDFSELLTRTDGNFLGLALQRGDWTVVDDAGDAVLSLSATATSLLGETGLALIPGNYRQDFTFSTDVRVDDSSPIGWDAGLVFRYRDAENHYRLRYSAGGLALDEMYQGTLQTLWSQSLTYNTDTWYKLEVVVIGDQFTIKRDDVTLTTISNSRFTRGDIGLASFDSATADFNDTTIDLPAAITWDFESDTEGEFPLDWKRLSYVNLPGGSATLTIADYLGQSDLKQVTVNIFWSDVTSTRTVIGSTIISN